MRQKQNIWVSILLQTAIKLKWAVHHQDCMYSIQAFCIILAGLAKRSASNNSIQSVDVNLYLLVAEMKLVCRGKRDWHLGLREYGDAPPQALCWGLEAVKYSMLPPFPLPLLSFHTISTFSPGFKFPLVPLSIFFFILIWKIKIL